MHRKTLSALGTMVRRRTSTPHRSTLNAMASSVSTVLTTVSTVASSVSTVLTTVSTVARTVRTMTSTVGTMVRTVSTMTRTVGTMTSTVTTMARTVSAMTSTVSTMTSTVSTTATEATEVIFRVTLLCNLTVIFSLKIITEFNILNDVLNHKEKENVYYDEPKNDGRRGYLVKRDFFGMTFLRLIIIY
jgi:hypothetical protein